VALSPLTPLPVQWENILVDLQPTSQYGADHDTAMINTTMLLQAPAAEEVIFALPSVDAPEQVPVLRVLAETPGVAAQFEETSFDEVDKALREAFAQGRRDDREFWDLLRKEKLSGISWTRVQVKAGQQLVRFHYPQLVPRQTDGSFQFRVLAPLASFVLNGGGGEISAAVGLPRLQGKTVQLQQASFENPPGTAAGDLSERPTVGSRQFVGHFQRQDPVYVVRYSYA
jgi:hypothetical protein